MPDFITRRPYRGGSMFPEMVPLRAMVDRLFENALTPAMLGEGRLGEAGRFGAFGMDVEEDDNAYYVRCHLPGVSPEEVNVQFHDNVLTISGETHREAPEGRRQVFRESSHGQFQRQLTLGAPVDPDRAEATYEHGVLEIKLPKSEAMRPRTIPVRSAGPAGATGAAETSSAQAASASSGSTSAAGTSAASGHTGSSGATNHAAASAPGEQTGGNEGASGGTRRRSTARGSK